MNPAIVRLSLQRVWSSDPKPEESTRNARVIAQIETHKFHGSDRVSRLEAFVVTGC